MKPVDKRNLVDFTVAGQVVKIGEPYEAGHPLTEIEASVLNQTYRENIRNGTAKEISEKPEQAQKIIDKYASTYAFGFRQSRVSLNPVASKARQIARDLVNKALQEKGIKKADYAGYEESVNKTAKRSDVIAAAEKIVAETSSVKKPATLV